MGKQNPIRTGEQCGKHDVVAFVALAADPSWVDAPTNPVTPGNGTEDWAADIEGADGGVIMSDWSSLAGAGAIDPLSGRELSDEELRERLGVE